MDFRELFRSFLGINRRFEPPGSGRNYQGSLDPSKADVDLDGENNNRGGKRTIIEEPNHRHGSEFIFGDMLHSMEDMFKEMEESMRDINSLFQDFGNQQFGFESFVSFNSSDKDNFNEDIQSLPPPENNYENMRSLVLKEKIPVLDKSEKIDKDLDDLYTKSALSLTDIPEPPKEAAPSERDVSSQTPTWNFNLSSFEKVYSTHSFKNGRWEGKTVRENNEGKEITTYSRNEQGEQEETVEFIPNMSTSPNNSSVTRPIDDRQLESFNPFQLLERLFKPRL